MYLYVVILLRISLWEWKDFVVCVGGSCQITGSPDRVKRNTYYVCLVCLDKWIHLPTDLLINLWDLHYYHYRLPLFLTKSASDSVVRRHLNSLSGNHSNSISPLEKKVPNLFVILSPVHVSHHSLSPGLSSITTVIPGASPFPFFFFSSLFISMSCLFSLDKTFVLFWGSYHVVPLFHTPCKVLKNFANSEVFSKDLVLRARPRPSSSNQSEQRQSR